MITIAVMAPKGGIGKTTTASCLSYILAADHKKKVLLVEGDPQGDLSKTYERYKPEGTGMSELLERHKAAGGKYTTRELIQQTDYPDIDIIPGNEHLTDTSYILRHEQSGNQITRFTEAMREISQDYDYCICDCGKLFDLVVINIIMAADLIMAPVKTGGYEAAAIQNLQEQIEDLRLQKPDIRIKAIMTMRQKNKAGEAFEDWLKESSGMDTYHTPIRRSVMAENATLNNMPLPEFSKTCVVVRDYREVAKELLTDVQCME